MQNLNLKALIKWRVKLATTLFSLASSSFAWSATPYNGMENLPWSSGFSPWNMGTNPWSSGFSPWSMGMGSNPWSTGFSPWGGSNWGSSMMPWASGNHWSNTWGNNSWLPWSNGVNFFGRRNNNDWVTSMFLMNSLNNQQPWNTGMLPNYNYQAPSWQQAPLQTTPNGSYQLPPAMLPNNFIANPNPAQVVQPAEHTNYPASSSSFSPFLDTNPPTTNPVLVVNPNQVQPSTSQADPTGKALVFPDGSRF